MWPVRTESNGDFSPGIPDISVNDVTIVTEHTDRIAQKMKIFTGSVWAMT